MTAERDPLDILWEQPDGVWEEHPGGRWLFRWERTTYQIRPVADDPDSWIIKGTGGEYRYDAAVGDCTCKGHAYHKSRCRHIRAMIAFLEAVGSTSKSNEVELTEEELKKLFA